jgi:type VI protein secretion system component VasF
MPRLHRHAVGHPSGRDGERGDVPGWVLITAMTVALVMLLWGVASEALREIITSFLDQVRFD